MTKPLAPEVRSEFAKRLKEMRVQAGFVRARYFAKQLGIEENRYTRYERAEVEPSLTLIHKMCDVLQVSPNELLGFAESAASVAPGFYENAPRQTPGFEDSRSTAAGSLAWRLAEAAVAARGAAEGADDPLASARSTGKLFQRLQSNPFSTIAEIAADEALQRLNAEQKAEIARLIKAYVDHVTHGEGRPRRAESRSAVG